MVDPTPHHRFEELAAGYVLGNLDSDEMAEFQQLAVEHPSLWEEVAGLQETLDLFPFALAESQPQPSARERMMQTAQTQSPASKQPKVSPKPQRPWAKIFGSIAAVTTMALGLQTVHFQQQLAQVRQELAEQKSLMATLPSTMPQTAPRNVVITTTDTFVNRNWQGVEQILVDHHKSLKKGPKAVDIPSNQPIELAALLRAQAPMPSAMPILSQMSSKLLGGSVCTFGKAKGVRIMYDTEHHGKVSFYQIARSQRPELPQFTPEKLYLAIQDGPGGVFWSDGEFHYAIVSDLSADELKELTSAVEIVES
ncbi:hypothetical protein HRE53_04515 [Acaryochloris sp. 'Moss Beach']|uniref:hypothetical protein n=1 Tax=Acaryochloris sp. 'Moss Beach' TaxID=2740837 RepID=UPI001F3C6438|nr:hypothetical protein [Acaryochloris sp. 'Moss Beach']UJB70380.1 hypothetical protein HRE53_04515 [Acaryochloris sp. 'Moss Beach']